jgi:two-component system OmpR family sensor kinase
MSLRARLMLGLLALAAVGLVIVDAVSYTQLRSYLLDRADHQAQAALPVVVNALGRPGRGGAERRLPAPLPFPPPTERGSQPVIPPGVFGEVRGPGGKVIEKTPRLLLGAGARKPRLPPNIPISPSRASPRTFTAPAPGRGSDYVVAAAGLPGERTIIAAVSLEDVNQTLAHVRLVGGIVTGAVLAALAALAWWVIRVGLSPLRRMEQTAGAIAAGDLSARVETTDERTEVGRLGIALNAMLGQIETAFAARAASEDRMRRFLADASHELRTPLTSIRGYAEAFRLGPARDPDQLERAMTRIEDESARMGVLVDDLLMLARLDEVREPVHEPVDLAAIATEAIEDATAAAPGRRIELRAGDGARVMGDADQLRRAVLNLLRNAIQHTRAGTPIDVSVTVASGETTLTVRDHGSGLPDGAAEHVFERFWRGEPSRGRDRGGAGLGLAIVAAIAQAHGGHASARNAEGGGAVFEVVLPARVPLSARRPRAERGP